MAGLILPSRFSQQPQQAAPVDPQFVNAGLASLTSFVGRERDVFGVVGLSRTGAGHVSATRNGGAGLSQATGANYWTTARPNSLIGSGSSFAVVLTFALNSLGQSNRYLMQETNGSGQTALIYGYVANTVEMFSAGAFSGSDPRPGSGIVVNDLLTHTVIYTYDGVTFAGYIDGRQAFSVARTFSLAGLTSGVLGAPAGGGSGVSDITVLQHARFSQGLFGSTARVLSANPWQLFQAPQRRLWAVTSAGPDVTLALSGQSATAAAGTLAPSSARALTGQASTAAIGTVSPATAKPLTGQAATSSQGTTTAGTSVAVSGQAATAAQGSVSAAQAGMAALAGQIATASAGSVTTGRTIAVTGQIATIAIGTLARGTTIALSGQSVTASAGTLTGSSAGNKTAALTGQVLTASQGTLAPPANYPDEYFFTIMRASVTNVAGGTMGADLSAQGGTISSSAEFSTIMRANTIDLAATMRTDSINVTGSLL